jgi:hypothetical protein
LGGIPTTVSAAQVITSVEGIIRTNPLGVKGRSRGFGVKGRGGLGVKERGAIIGIDAAVVVVAARGRGPVVEDHTLLDAEAAEQTLVVQFLLQLEQRALAFRLGELPEVLDRIRNRELRAAAFSGGRRRRRLFGTSVLDFVGV